MDGNPSCSPSSQLVAQPTIAVLSLDGGGLKGLLTLQMLKELERRTGKRIRELFQVIAGTSTGGILALAIQEGVPLEFIERLYLLLGQGSGEGSGEVEGEGEVRVRVRCRAALPLPYPAHYSYPAPTLGRDVFAKDASSRMGNLLFTGATAKVRLLERTLQDFYARARHQQQDGAHSPPTPRDLAAEIHNARIPSMLQVRVGVRDRVRVRGSG